jgi:hypothetical protein
MGEPAVRASQVREDIWQRSEAIGIDLNASRDRSACVWTLDEQNTHATLLSTSFLRTRRNRIWRRERLEKILEKSSVAVMTVCTPCLARSSD